MNASFRLHSKYNPQKEADNFALQVKTTPLFVVLTEPGESYLSLSFRKNFPNAKIFAIRYTNNLFLEYDNLFDAVWRPKDGDLNFFLIQHIPDEFFSRSIFLSWKPSENIWREEARKVWKEIKEASNLFISLIRTRSFFGKKWCKNLFNNIIFSKSIKMLELDSVSDAVFLTSGYSLEKFIKDENIKNHLKNDFVTSASSSLSALNYQKVRVDLAFATDGGFWAGHHLKSSFSNLAIPLEAYVPLPVLEEKNIVFLNYGSELENYLFEKMSIPFLEAKRNGTVAGTAIEVLLDYVKDNIFVSGLDLSFSKSFTHARPNKNINESLKKESKVCPLSTILAYSSFNNSNLSIYASWFSSISKNKKQRIFRLGNEGINIEGIKRITNNDFIKLCKHYQKEKKLEDFDCKERKNILLSFFKKIRNELDNETFFNNIMDVDKKSLEKELCQLIVFSDYVSLIKDYESKKNEIQKIIKEKIIAFLEKEETLIR